MSPAESLNEPKGRDIDPIIDRPNPDLVSGYPGANESVGVSESGARHEEASLKPLVTLDSDSSAGLGPIENQNSLDVKQPAVEAALQVAAETRNEAVFEPGSAQMVGTLSEDVPSNAEKVAQTIISTAIGGVTPSVVSVVSEFILPFGFNKTVTKDLSKSARQERNALAESCPHTIRIVGHTCSTGPFLGNHAVARLRAIFVKDLLVKQGLAADRIEVISVGKKKPIASK